MPSKLDGRAVSSWFLASSRCDRPEIPGYAGSAGPSGSLPDAISWPLPLVVRMTEGASTAPLACPSPPSGLMSSLEPNVFPIESILMNTVLRFDTAILTLSPVPRRTSVTSPAALAILLHFVLYHFARHPRAVLSCRQYSNSKTPLQTHSCGKLHFDWPSSVRSDVFDPIVYDQLSARVRGKNLKQSNQDGS